MQCTVRSPDETYFDSEATMLVARSDRGEFAVMDGHAPLLAHLLDGLLRVETSDGRREFACFGATLRVEADTVTVLVEEAVAVSDIDFAAIEARLGETLDETSSEHHRLTVLAKLTERHA